MTARDLYLCAYDIADPARGRRALREARSGALGGQFSAHEVLASHGEARALLVALRRLLDPEADAALLLRLDPRSAVGTLGVARAPVRFFYFG